tara:strand:- start:3575 stop:4093 length:519 start_codon:yes stop_codon:yes gene_type:complete
MIKPKHFILDVDGVMTDGSFYYSKDGKIMKSFGPDDSDALNLLKKYINIEFISADKRGFDISKKRIEDIGYKINLVGAADRVDWFKEKFDLNEVIFMGDGIFDHYVMKLVTYSVSPSNGDEYTKSIANFVTKRVGGDRAVAEASLHILQRFFTKYDPNKKIIYNDSNNGWSQ